MTESKLIDVIAHPVPDKKEQEMEGDKNIPFTLLGAGLLWIGWSGYVP